ncbi:MAG: hypothetical protein WKF36_10375 [Candidatus Nitrosocosmicus sp.]
MWPREYTPLSSPDSIPFDKAELRKYLKETFNWDWVDVARITPLYDRKMVDIDNPNNLEDAIRVSIYEKDNKALLMKNENQMCEFIITVYDLFLSIDVRTNKKKVDLLIEYLVEQCKDHTTSFLTNLRSQVNPTNQDYQLLSTDEKFVSALEDIDKNIQIR